MKLRRVVWNRPRRDAGVRRGGDRARRRPGTRPRRPTSSQGSTRGVPAWPCAECRHPGSRAPAGGRTASDRQFGHLLTGSEQSSDGDRSQATSFRRMAAGRVARPQSSAPVRQPLLLVRPAAAHGGRRRLDSAGMAAGLEAAVDAALTSEWTAGVRHEAHWVFGRGHARPRPLAPGETRVRPKLAPKSAALAGVIVALDQAPAGQPRCWLRPVPGGCLGA